MNLYELIQCIPEFINQVLFKMSNQSQQEVGMIGKFYLGLQYDYQ